MSAPSARVQLGAETVWVILICLLGVLAYLIAMCWLVCCFRERRWGPAEGLPALAGDLMFVRREPGDEGQALSQDEDPKIPGSFMLGHRLGGDGDRFGRVVVLKGSCGFVVWSVRDEDECQDDEELERRQMRARLDPESYGAILPGQKFRLHDVEPGTFLCLEEYRLPTPEEKEEHAAAVAEATLRNAAAPSRESKKDQ